MEQLVGMTPEGHRHRVVGPLKDREQVEECRDAVVFLMLLIVGTMPGES